LQKQKKKISEYSRQQNDPVSEAAVDPQGWTLSPGC
jgi:hypothetical protein